MQSRVVGCAPVPKARPGSITTGSRPSGGSSHGGPTQSEPIRTGRWKARQRSSQSAATSCPRAPPNACQSRSSPPRVRVRDELDAVRRFDLFEARGKSSSICARASSARSTDTSTETRRTTLSGTRSSTCRGTPRPARTSRRCETVRTPPAAAAARRQLPRHDDAHEDALAAASESLQHRQALPAQDVNLAGLRAGLEGQVDVSLERRHRHGRAERSLREPELDGGVDVVAFADEPLVGSDVHLDVGVACRAAEAVPAWPSPGGGCAGRRGCPPESRPRAFDPRARDRLPRHCSHGCSTSGRISIAAWARRVRTNSPKTLRETLAHAAAADARRAGTDGRAGLCAVAAAMGTGDCDFEGDLALTPVTTSTRSISTRAAMSAPRPRPPRPRDRRCRRRRMRRGRRGCRSGRGSVEKPPLRRPGVPEAVIELATLRVGETS